MSVYSLDRVVACERENRIFVRSVWGADKSTKDCVDVSQLQGVYVRAEKVLHEGRPVWAGPIDPRQGYSVSNPGPCRVYSHSEGKKGAVWMISDNVNMTQDKGLPGLLKASEPHNGKPPYTSRDWRVANMKIGHWVPAPRNPILRVDGKSRYFINCPARPQIQGMYDLVQMIDGMPCWGQTVFRLYPDKEGFWVVSELVGKVEKKLAKSELHEGKHPHYMRYWKVSCAVKKEWQPTKLNIEIVDISTSMGHALRNSSQKCVEVQEALASQMNANAPASVEVVCPAVQKYSGHYELSKSRHNACPYWEKHDKRLYCDNHGHWHFTEHASGMLYGFAGIRSTELHQGRLPHQMPGWSVAEQSGKKTVWREASDVTILPSGPMGAAEEALQDRVKKLIEEVNRLRSVGSGEVETYENQRYIILKGWGQIRLPHDRPSWSDNAGKVSLEKDDCKLPPHCEWDGDWVLDKTGMPSANGWMYGADYPGVAVKYHPKRGMADVLRRRRWYRKYKPIVESNVETSNKKSTKSSSSSNSSQSSVFEVAADDDEDAESLAHSQSLSNTQKRVSLLLPTSNYLMEGSSSIVENTIPTTSTSEDSNAAPVCIKTQRTEAVLRLIETELDFQDNCDEQVVLQRIQRVTHWLAALETPGSPDTPVDESITRSPQTPSAFQIERDPRIAEALKCLKEEVSAFRQEPTKAVFSPARSLSIYEATNKLAWEVTSNKRLGAVICLSAIVVNTFFPEPAIEEDDNKEQRLTNGISVKTVLSISDSSSSSSSESSTEKKEQPLPRSQPQSQSLLSSTRSAIVRRLSMFSRNSAKTSKSAKEIDKSDCAVAVDPDSLQLELPQKTPPHEDEPEPGIRRRLVSRIRRKKRPPPTPPSPAQPPSPTKFSNYSELSKKLVKKYGSSRGFIAYLSGISTGRQCDEQQLMHTFRRADIGFDDASHLISTIDSLWIPDIQYWIEDSKKPVAVVCAVGVMSMVVAAAVETSNRLQRVSSQFSIISSSPYRSVRRSYYSSRSSPATSTSDAVCCFMLSGECPNQSPSRLSAAVKSLLAQRLCVTSDRIVDLKTAISKRNATCEFRVTHGGEDTVRVLLRAPGWSVRGIAGRWMVTRSSPCIDSDLGDCPLGHKMTPVAVPYPGTPCDARHCRGVDWALRSVSAFGCQFCEYSICDTCAGIPQLTPSPSRTQTFTSNSTRSSVISFSPRLASRLAALQRRVNKCESEMSL
eukprot:TRINITY_DN24765_c0_g1_i1.p1 TRINITY_DN24765_c0_g1~~TRINITY_DN24765_c0_g1_i1.p1  ORF type:complete len:1220 (+),score=205.01 TRINITY_DN24765_c0_g1_i1:43-3702(+)